MLTFASQPNAPHCGEVGKMLVLSSARLDTESSSTGDMLDRSCGWTEFGKVPDHAFKPDGRLAETTFFYKRLTR